MDQFAGQFEKDILEAYEWWVQKQGGVEITVTQWISRLLARPVYELIAEKRIIESEAPNGGQEGQKGQIESH